LFSITGTTLVFLFIPLSIGIAILRFRLWDIDPIINRTLVYGALSFLTIAFYILVVGGFAIYFRNNESNIIISFIATGMVAILFEPLRQRLQRGVNRLMYGSVTTHCPTVQPASRLCPCTRFRFADDRGDSRTDSSASLCCHFFTG
jgi:hypothetical protein